MALRLGAYTACLHDRPLEAALEVLESNGLTSVEVNTGGFIPSPHGVGPKHADDLRRTIELASLLGVPNVVTMSGSCPPWPRSTRTWPSTSSMRTPATPASTAWPSRPGTSAPPPPRCDLRSARSGARLGEATSHPQEAHVTTPPDFGGEEIEEGLLEDLGGPQERYPVSHQDERGTDFSDNELHAAGQTCPRCGTAILPGQDVRRRADHQWVHEDCPASP